MPFFELKQILSKKIATFLNHPEISAQTIEKDFGTPPQSQLGHLALPCFKLSKILKQPSDKIAKSLQAHFAGSKYTVNPTGPYANFSCDIQDLYQETTKAIFSNNNSYGSDSSGGKAHIIIEYCSPNIAKRLAFQHIRSTLIGNTLSNIYDYLGYKTERMNFVGDWGSQFARLLAAVDKWGVEKSLNSDDLDTTMDHLFNLYVRFHKEADENPSLIEAASHCLQRLEEKEAQSVEAWKKIRDISIRAMTQTLDKLNVRFNHIEGESQYIDDIGSTLKEIKSRANARLSEGAWIVDVPNLATPALIQKKDGTTLYLTRDLAAAVDRFNRFNPDRMYYVVSEQQRLHFQLLFGVLKLMGYSWADKCQHLSFGTVLFGAEKMSTREGKVIFLDEILKEATKRALAECTAKNPTLENKDEVAKAVGIGAVIFGNLSTQRKTDFEFKWESVLLFDGETGPYVQYSTVRCHSLLKNAKEKGFNVDPTFLPLQYAYSLEEESLILALSKLRAILHIVINDNEPFHLTNYLIDLAKAFNRFYYKIPVLQSGDPTSLQLRLNLVAATEVALTCGLKLLGIQVPEAM